MPDRIKIAKRTVDALEPRASRYVAWDTVLPGFGVKVLPSGRKSFVFKYRVGGGRGGLTREPVIGSHGEIAPDQARRIAKGWAAEVALGRDPGGARQEARVALTLDDLLERYLREHARPHKKASSTAEDEALIRNYLSPAFGTRKAEALTRAEIARWHAGLARTPYRANRALALLSKAMNLAEVWGLRPDGSNPCRQIRKFREEKRERFLSPEETARLGEALTAAESGRLRTASGLALSPFAVAAIRLLLFTGARRSEILGLQWAWVDLDGGFADLPDSKTGRKRLFLPPPAVAVLSSLPRLDDNPFVIAGAKPGAALVNIRDPWHVVRAAAGLDDLRLHDLRHSFASVAVANGMSLPLIGGLLGHRSVATTARYAHLADDPQRLAAAAVGGRIEAALAGGRGGASVVGSPEEERP
ncbi:MAG: tyrosine-type recombinase/integrase [Pseudomonadota bacterium]